MSEKMIDECDVSIIAEHDRVIIEFDQNYHLFLVEKLKKIKIGKNAFIQGKELIGQKFNAELTINKDGKIEESSISIIDVLSDVKIGFDADPGDGRKVFDNKSIQILNEELISEIKKHSSSTVEMIKAMVGTSRSFKDKTTYSQEKYIKKKAQKYHPIFVIHRCNSNYLSKFYYQKFPHKIYYIRPDGLAQVLYFASLAHNSRVILFESTQGLIAGSVLERLSPSGSLLQFYQGTTLSNRICSEFALMGKSSHWTYDIESSLEIALDNHGKIFDSLIVASRFEPLPIIQVLLPFVLSSSSIVVFSNHIEPLIDVYSYLKEVSKGFDLFISDTFLRTIKVEEGSTHPEVKMDGRSGYILRGFIINN